MYRMTKNPKSVIITLYLRKFGYNIKAHENHDFKGREG